MGVNDIILTCIVNVSIKVAVKVEHYISVVMEPLTGTMINFIAVTLPFTGTITLRVNKP